MLLGHKVQSPAQVLSGRGYLSKKRKVLPQCLMSPRRRRRVGRFWARRRSCSPSSRAVRTLPVSDKMPTVPPALGRAEKSPQPAGTALAPGIGMFYFWGRIALDGHQSEA